MAKRNRNQQTDARGATADLRPPRRAKRWKHRVGLLLLLLTGAVAAAPTLVSRTSLRNTLPSEALPAGWRLESQQASLGWTGSQTLLGVTLMGAQGEPLLTAESLTLPRSLVELALNRSNLGKLALVRPVAYLETRSDGSNWQDFLSALEKKATGNKTTGQHSPADKQLELEVEITDGAVRGIDRVTGQQWSLTAANLLAVVGASTQVNGSLQLTTAEQTQPGHLRFQWRTTEVGQQQVELLAEQLPLAPLQPWLARVLPGGELAGTLSADGQMTWSVDSERRLLMQTSGRFEASQCELTAAVLQGDRLRFQHIRAPWQLSLIDQRLTIEQLAVDADWATLDMTGSLTVAELQSLDLDHLPKRPARLAGKIDLAQLVVLLPRTLPLRSGVRIDAGELEFDLANEPRDARGGEGVVWTVTGGLQNVAGSDGSCKIRWEESIEAALSWLDSPAGRQLEQLTLTSPFAQAHVVTRQSAIEGEFEIDFARFSQEWGQFVDLDAWQMRGLGEGTFALARLADQRFAAEAKIDVTDLHVANGVQPTWVEPKYQIGLQAIGTEQNLVPQRVATAKLQLLGPRDQLELELLEPVDLRAGGESWQLKFDGNGPLQLWAARLRPWLAAVPEQLEGDAHLRANVQIATDRIRLTEATGSVVQLRVQSESISIDEPRVELAGDALWDAATKSLMARELQLLGSSFSFRAREVAVALADAGAPTASGSVAFRADLERLAAIAGFVGRSTATWPQGSAVGQLQLTSHAERLQADFGVKIETLQLVRMTAASGAAYGQPEILWKEPQLEVEGVVKYQIPTDRLEFDNLQVRGKTLRLNSSAAIDRVSSEGLLQASGLVQYDANELARFVASYAGPGMQWIGDQQVRFQIEGPLFPAVAEAALHWSHRYSGTAEAGWSSAGVYGLPLGGGRLQGNLRDGQLQFAPLDVAIGRGRLTAQPRATLFPGVETIYLTPGPLVKNVAISQQVSENMLKYIAPIVAGATRAEGEFSMQLEHAEVPLESAEQARVQGQLAVHQLIVSPGPMVAQLATLVEQLEAITKNKQFIPAATSPRTKSILTIKECQVDFQIVEGRVYHRNLEFLIDNTPVRSYGSVGFDQTLALEIEVPIQDKWLAREPKLRSLAGRSLKIPIYGTFQKPRIDERAFADLSRQLLQGVATEAIGNELNRQFEKLFRGK